MSLDQGLDPDAVRRIRDDLARSQRKANAVSQRTNLLVAQLRTHWAGHNSDDFVARWNSRGRPALQAVGEALETIRHELETQVLEQERASAEIAAAGLGMCYPPKPPDSQSTSGLVEKGLNKLQQVAAGLADTAEKVVNTTTAFAVKTFELLTQDPKTAPYNREAQVVESTEFKVDAETVVWGVLISAGATVRKLTMSDGTVRVEVDGRVGAGGTKGVFSLRGQGNVGLGWTLASEKDADLLLLQLGAIAASGSVRGGPVIALLALGPPPPPDSLKLGPSMKVNVDTPLGLKAEAEGPWDIKYHPQDKSTSLTVRVTASGAAVLPQAGHPLAVGADGEFTAEIRVDASGKVDGVTFTTQADFQAGTGADLGVGSASQTAGSGLRLTIDLNKDDLARLGTDMKQLSAHIAHGDVAATQRELAQLMRTTSNRADIDPYVTFKNQGDVGVPGEMISGSTKHTVYAQDSSSAARIDPRRQ